jgi:hypothetical protein
MDRVKITDKQWISLEKGIQQIVSQVETHNIRPLVLQAKAHKKRVTDQ